MQDTYCNVLNAVISKRKIVTDMLGFLWRLIVGRFSSCTHKWEILQWCDVTSHGTKIGTRYHLQCTHCGNVKKKDCF